MSADIKKLEYSVATPIFFGDEAETWDRRKRKLSNVAHLCLSTTQPPTRRVPLRLALDLTSRTSECLHPVSTFILKPFAPFPAQPARLSLSSRIAFRSRGSPLNSLLGTFRDRDLFTRDVNTWSASPIPYHREIEVAGGEHDVRAGCARNATNGKIWLVQMLITTTSTGSTLVLRRFSAIDAS